MVVVIIVVCSIKPLNATLAVLWQHVKPFDIYCYLNHSVSCVVMNFFHWTHEHNKICCLSFFIHYRSISLLFVCPALCMWAHLLFSLGLVLPFLTYLLCLSFTMLQTDTYSAKQNITISCGLAFAFDHYSPFQISKPLSVRYTKMPHSYNVYVSYIYTLQVIPFLAPHGAQTHARWVISCCLTYADCILV